MNGEFFDSLKTRDRMRSFLTTAVPETPAARTATENIDSTKAKIAMRLKGLWKTYPGNAQPAVQGPFSGSVRR